jgi:hypothetical protein
MASGLRKSWVLPLAVLPLVACKPKPDSNAPERDVRSWTLAEIEAELAHNDQVLAGEGIMVAAAAPPVTPTYPVGPSEPVAEEPSTTGDEPPPGEDDQGEISPEPVPQPPDPGPGPTTAPTTAPEPHAAPEAELLADDGASSISPSEHRRASRRRLAARRDTDTRCDRVCGLAEATCELEAQICELAARHPDEPRYAQACVRAEQQCEAASQACQRCED